MLNMTMATMTTPLLTVLNLGGELLYVLDQRLRAQKIPRQTATKVLADIIGVLFDENLLKELEVTPRLGKHTYVKQLIEDVASVSIMRLDRLSMDKLWELCVMVFKWQLSLIEPERLVDLTKKHLWGVADLMPGHPVMGKVQRCLLRLEDASATVTEQEIVLMRNSILSWLNDFHIKVSLLLRMGFQRTDGSFVAVVDPDDEASAKILANLGGNIYAYEMNEADASDSGTAGRNADVSEVSLLARDILGESSHEKAGERIRIEHYFLQRENDGGGHHSKDQQKAPPANVCEFEMSSSSHRKAVVALESIEDELQESNERGSSLRDDLLNMLEENTEV